jgi:four helix bundle protein
MAFGSLSELETHLLLAREVGIVTDQTLQPLLSLSNEVGRMLTGLRQSLRRKLTQP